MSNKFDVTNQFNTEFQKILDEQGYVTLTQYYELVDKYIFCIGDAKSMHPYDDGTVLIKNPLY